jgi:Ca2+-transporting ATPase
MNILSRRTEKTVFTRYLFTNKFLWATLAISLFFVFAIVYVPLLQYFLQTAGLAPLHWLFIIGGAVVYLMLHEIRKIFIHQPLYNL